MKDNLIKKKIEFFFFLSFSGAFSLYYWDFLNINDYFFIPTIYENSHILFLIGIGYLFLILLTIILINYFFSKNYLFYKVYIFFLSILFIESLKDYFNLKISLSIFIPIIMILFFLIITNFKISKIILNFFLFTISPFFIFFFVSIYLGIDKFNERNYNFDNLEKISKLNDKINLILVFDELDWRVLNEKKYQKYKFNSNFYKLLQQSTIYENSFINGNSTKTNLLSIINNQTYSLNEVNEMILNFKKNNLSEISLNKNNMFRKLNENNQSIGFVGYYLQECNVYKQYFNYCHYLNNGYRSMLKFPIDFVKYLIAQVVPLSKNLITINNESSFLKQKKNFDLLNNGLIEKLISSNLDTIFMHIPFPHGPYIYNIKIRNFENIYDNNDYDRNKSTINHEHYLGNIYLADKILGEIMFFEKKYKKKINYYVLSDTGINKDLDNYNNLNSSKFSVKNQLGHTTFFFKRYNQIQKETIFKKVLIPDLLHLNLFK